MSPPASPEDPEGFLPAGGNYRELLSYQKSKIVYDFTFRFCEKFLKRGDRTIDQMVQAARSGKQNPFHPPSGLRQGYDRQAGPAQLLFHEPPAKANSLQSPGRP